MDLRPVPNFKEVVKFKSNPYKSYIKPLFNDFEMWHQKNAYDTILVSYDNNQCLSTCHRFDKNQSKSVSNIYF